MAESKILETTPWRTTRAKWTWGILVLSIVLSFLLHWISQIAVGAIIGAVVGLEEITVFLDSEWYQRLGTDALFYELAVTAVVALIVTRRTFKAWSWHDGIHEPPSPPQKQFQSILMMTKNIYPQDYGMFWFPTFWRPVLIGTLVYGIIFATFFWMGIEIANRP